MRHWGRWKRCWRIQLLVVAVLLGANAAAAQSSSSSYTSSSLEEATEQTQFSSILSPTADVSSLSLAILALEELCPWLQARAATYELLVGASIDFVCSSSEEELRKFAIADLQRSAATSEVDGMVIPASLLPDLADGIAELRDFVSVDGSIDLGDVFELYREFSTVAGSSDKAPQAVPIDGESLVLYYRRDIVPVPPQTWSEMAGMVAVADGSDHNGDSTLDYGSCIPLTEDGSEMEYFYGIYAPMIQTNGTSQGVFFDADTFEPVVRNPVFRSAASVLRSLVNDRIATTEEAKNNFFNGRCAFYIGSVAVGKEIFLQNGFVRNLVEAAPLPGTFQVFDRDEREVVNCNTQPLSCPFADTSGINRAPFIAFGGWTGAVRASTINPLTQTVIYDFFSFLSTPEESAKDVTRDLPPNIYRESHVEENPSWSLSPYDTLPGQAFVNSYLDVVTFSVKHPNAAVDLKVLETARYKEAFNENLLQFLRDEIDSLALMQFVYGNWTEITREVGAEEQLGFSPSSSSSGSSSSSPSSSSDSGGGFALALISIPIAGVIAFLLLLCIAVLLVVIIVVKVRGNQQKYSRYEHFASWLLNYEDLDIKEEIGMGSFGAVYRAEYRGTEVAVKHLKDELKEESLYEFLQEISMMCELRHPNVLLFMGACIKPPCIVTEYMPRGSLYDVLHDDNIVLDWMLIQTMALDAAQGMDFLHSASPPILHADFKSLNLLVDKKWNLKVGDFGLTRLKGTKTVNMDNRVGSIFWTAPEVLRGEEYTEKSDVYSYGVVLWELLTRSNPYEGMNPMYVALAVMDEGLRPPVPIAWHEDMVNLLNDCWDDNPKKRPTFKEIRKALEVMDVPCVGMTSKTNFSVSFAPMKGYEALPSAAVPIVQPPTGIITFAFTDIAGYASLWAEAPHAMQRAMKIHNELLREVTTDMGGYEVKSENDSFMLAFAEADSAVSACMILQEALVRQPWPKELLRHKEAAEVRDKDGRIIYRGLRLRVGMNTGAAYSTTDMVSGRADYFGNAVNRAAKATGLAFGGEILITRNTLEAVEDLSSLSVEPQLTKTNHTLGNKNRTVYLVLPGSLKNRVSFHKSGFDLRTSDGVAIADQPTPVQRWLINYDDITFGRKIGVGSFGEVYKAKWQGAEVAVKKFFRQQASDQLLLELRKESVIMSRLRHPNILLFIGACVIPPKLCIVTEYMPGGNVAKLLHNRSIAIPWPTRLKMIKGVALGMNYLHSFKQPFIHRDLTSYNLLVDKGFNVKIGDFGLSRIKANNATMTRCGTAAWTAPEILKGLDYSEKSDIYSFGIILWEFLTRKKPFKSMQSVKISQLVTQGARPRIPDGTPADYKHLMVACWQTNPDQRPSFAHIIDTLDCLEGSVPEFESDGSAWSDATSSKAGAFSDDGF